MKNINTKNKEQKNDIIGEEELNLKLLEKAKKTKVNTMRDVEFSQEIMIEDLE